MGDRFSARSVTRLGAVPLVLFALVGIGCRGVVGGPGGSPSGESPDGRDPDATVVDCKQTTFGSSPMRRLSHREYDNAVRELLEITTNPARGFVADSKIGLYDNTASSQTVPTLLAEQYLDTAIQLAADADLNVIVGCDRSTESCVRDFAERFAGRAYRRPASADEVDTLLGLYRNASTEANEDTAVQGVIAAVLTSPSFLFRPEFGRNGAASPATSYEVASRLASFLWASIPDRPLLELAASDGLDTRKSVEAEARRMIEDARAQPAIETFFHQWFGLAGLEDTEKDPDEFPDFTDALKDAMTEETQRFIGAVLWEEDGRLETLFSAPWTFANGLLAAHYGIPGPSDDATFARITLDNASRAGVVTHAGLLAMLSGPRESSPILRGQWVRERIFCHELPPVPDDVPELPPIDPNVSNRERFAQHTSDPACAGCHSLIDGIGFGLEEYDAVGRLRTDGEAVDTSGEITKTEDIDGSFEGGLELADRLATSGQVRSCAVEQAFRFASGRVTEPEDECAAQLLEETFDASGGDLKELMVQIAASDAFRTYGGSK